MTIGDRIKKLRNDKGMTQEELAKHINSTKQTIYKYENNIVTNIPSDKIEKIAAILQTTPGYLMGWTKNSKSYNEIDYFENTLIKVINTIKESGYYVDYDKTDLVLIYDKNKNLIKTVREENLVKAYEDTIKKNPKLVVSELLEPNKPHTIAAHLPEGVELTGEEKEQLNDYIQFLLSKRKK